MLSSKCFAALSGAALMLSFGGAVSADEPAVSFTKQVAPILLKNCQTCHGARDAKGGYQVTNYQLLLKPGDSDSAPVTAGKPDASELLKLIASDDVDTRMPKDGDPLSKDQVALLKRWIAEGAKFDGPDQQASLASIVPRLPQPDPPASYRRPLPITAVAFSPDGQELAVGGYHEITIWNPTSGELLRRIKNVAERIYGLAYRADGAMLAVAAGTPGQLGEVKLFEPREGKLIKELGTMTDVEFRVAFNPAGDKLAACGADRAIRVYNVETGKQELLIEDHADWVIGLAWSPDGARLASASRDKTSKVFNATSGESATTYSGHNEQVYGVTFSADIKRVFSGGGDKKIHVWNPDDGKKIVDGGGFTREVLGVVCVGARVFGCSADNSVREVKAEKLEAVRTYPGHTDAVFCVAFHEGTKRLAAGSFTGEVRLWNTDDGAALLTFVAAPGYTPPTPPVTPAAPAKK